VSTIIRHRWWLAAVVTAGGEVVLVHLSAAPGGIIFRRFGLFWNIAGCWALFAVAAACLYRVRSTRVVVVTALALGVLLRLAAIAPQAPLSDDLYRYAWDGTVQTHGIDPYRYPPLAPQLAGLRTSPWLFPADYRDHTRINRPDVRTIYPPVAEAWFTAVHLVVPLSLRDRGFEFVGLLVELAVLAVLLALLRGENRRRIVLYAWCPLPIVEAVQNAHIDGLAVLCVLLTMVAMRRSHGRWATVALAAATLIKIYPVLLLPVLLRRTSWRERLWRSALFAGMIVLAYLPHVIAVGPKVLGYLPGYLREEKYTQGNRYLLLALVGVPQRAATVIVVALFAATVFWVWRTRADDIRSAIVLLSAALLLTTPVQPWYALSLAALVAVSGNWCALGICVAGYGLYFGTILQLHPVGYGQLGYGLAAVMLAGGWLAIRFRTIGRRESE
jgi:hypothetical protein